MSSGVLVAAVAGSLALATTIGIAAPVSRPTPPQGMQQPSAQGQTVAAFAYNGQVPGPLLRMKEGTYGICNRCGEPIDERRLEALPTARYDAQCQAIIESANGEDDLPTL